MKRFIEMLVLVIVCALIIGTVAKANEITFDGQISPTEMMTWEVQQRFMDKNMFIHILFTNPDTDAEIKHVEGIFKIDPNVPNQMILLGYAYDFRGELYVIINDGNGHYRQIQPELINANDGKTKDDKV